MQGMVSHHHAQQPGGAGAGRRCAPAPHASRSARVNTPVVTPTACAPPSTDACRSMGVSPARRATGSHSSSGVAARVSASRT